jgi:hypothetical protein
VFDAYISGGCSLYGALEHGFGFMVWWRRVVVLLGLFAGPVFGSLWDLAGLVVDVKYYGVGVWGWLLWFHGGAAFFLEGRRVDVAYF